MSAVLEYDCGECGQLFATEDDVVAHAYEAHPDDCPECLGHESDMRRDRRIEKARQ